MSAAADASRHVIFPLESLGVGGGHEFRLKMDDKSGGLKLFLNSRLFSRIVFASPL